jgi:hypothetical protein
MYRSSRAASFVATVVLGGTLAVAGAGRAADAPCTIATKGDSPVAKACADGGIPKAKAAMKAMATKARKGGTKFQCDDCHKDDVKYDLTADARDKFKKLLAASEGAATP